jgi:hypothetical protein
MFRGFILGIIFTVLAAAAVEEAERFRRDNPDGLIFRRLIVHAPNGEPNWERVSREKREREGEIWNTVTTSPALY